MSDNRILVVADDLTGALEVSAKFAAAGIESLVKTRSGQSSHDTKNSRVLVVNTETRHAPASEAAASVYELACATREQSFSFIYKKTDSTLRGNIGAELAALIEAYSGAPLLYVPAYPELGRTVSNGILFVDGVPVSETCFAKDPFNPVCESHLPTLLAAQCRFPIRTGRLQDFASAESWSISICDSDDDLDLALAARSFLDSGVFRLAAGPSGFASHLARLLDVTHDRTSPLPRAKNVLIVNGSLHQLSLRQIREAKQMGFKSVGGHSTAGTTADWGWVILEPEDTSGGATLEFAKRLAKEVCRLLAFTVFDALVVFGGDTAFAILEEMGNPNLHPIGEVMEGIPISRIEAKTLGGCRSPEDRDLLLITKAGGFGPLDLLASVRRLVGEN